MKKYVKPDLYYENFELSHNVASCSMWGQDTKKQSNHSSGSSCYYELDGNQLFSNSSAGCKVIFQKGDLYCYQTGNDGVNFFSS